MNSSTPPGASFGTNIADAQDLRWASAAMRELESDIACAAECDARVMISGERGTGKKCVARLIHRRSLRGEGPLVIARCPEVVESLLPIAPGSESVDRFKRGLLKAAENGTLLLEEIQRIPTLAQFHVLRFIESEMSSSCDVRLMTATRADLLDHVRSNQFRNDLFYHLNVIHLVIPALRDRPEDIPILFRHYLSVDARADVPRLSPAAWDRLAAYSWPGNVQELKAVAEKVAVQDLRRLVEPDDLPSQIGR